ncbi:uncharacterized protein F5891DRAFT_1180360 [Suillus fuscotomentosus]|uniref:Uncharacterized protein n=1 Tax=Suillus fuscotomentosus TaxID=1912939 RepID=A0AAD4EMG7_9AGAM|nr:uncharacterized protein F5891DRAFT_1180360 [Suillus fuscotomentosus]KAG1908796.1 hypothetical protein F5891DRAFT_1180360 [Suillus fuscotomentosus]
MTLNNADLVDGIVLRYSDNTRKRIQCTVCPLKHGKYRLMEFRHISKHIVQGVHVHRTQIKCSKQRRKVVQATAHTNDVDANDSFDMNTDSPMDTNFYDAPSSMVPVSVEDNGPSESELGLSELLHEIGDRTFGFDKGPLDLFAELKAIITTGEVPFSTPLAPINDEQELSDDSADFGIELPDDIYERTNIKDTVPLDSPTYPWPSKVHFVTSLLFSSLRLPFSDAQKRAILSWAQELGA